MTEITGPLLDQKLNVESVELNNNDTFSSEGNQHDDEDSFEPQKSPSRLSLSSISSINSDNNEDHESASLETEQPNKKCNSRQLRSMSDGQATNLINPESTDVFPSLPDSVLEKLGLNGEGPRQRLNEEELEQKFVALALAFTIDAATIKDRSERQRRYRDQTETNLIKEIDRLTEKVARIQPICVDAETAELLTGLFAQIDIIIRASTLAAISAERFGAVQHEERLSDAVDLMINHVTLLKQQRDSTRKQLQYTKKMLQATNSESANAKQKGGIANGESEAKRRASIATISRTVENGKHVSTSNPDIRRATRRTSDLTTRVSTFARAARPSRLELGVELNKIKEGIIDENGSNEQVANIETSQDNVTAAPTEVVKEEVHPVKLSLKDTFLQRCQQYGVQIQESYERCASNSSFHDFCYCASLLCFVFSIIILSNLWIEIEISRINSSQQPPHWTKLFSRKT